MHEKSHVSSAMKYDCFKLDGSGNCIIRKTWLHCIWFEKKFRLNEVILHCTWSVNCRLCLQHFNEYHASEYSLMSKSINKFLADQNVIQSLEQQFDYLFKCAGVKLMSCWDLKEHHIITIINNQKRKVSIEFPQYFICLRQSTKFHR